MLYIIDLIMCINRFYAYQACSYIHVYSYLNINVQNVQEAVQSAKE